MLLVYLLALVSGVFYGVNESIWKSITEKKYSVFAYAFLQWFLNLLVFAIPFILSPTLPRDPRAYLYMTVVVIGVIVANLSIIKAYKTEDISYINIISRISLVVTFLSGVFLLSESVNLYKIMGVGAILVGVVVLFYEGKKFRLSEGFLFTLFSGFIYGLIVYFYKMALQYFSYVSFLFVFNLAASLISVAMPRVLHDVRPIFAKHRGKILFSRLFINAASLLFLWSISHGYISVVNTNSDAAYLLVTVFIGIIILRERKDIAKKIAGSLLCVLGIVLLNFF